jgi:thiol:disulfide interchange protein DsbC
MLMKSFHRAIRKASPMLLATCIASTAIAGEAIEGKIKAAVIANTEGKVLVTSVAKSPVSGIYEVVSGQEIFYTDATGQYAFVDGRLMDLKTHTDLTTLRLEKLSSVDFKDLPLHLAVKTVNGNGRRVIAIFEDPACPICKSLHKFTSQLPDSTVYAFMYPVVSPESIPKAQAAWCSPDKAQAWSILMNGGPAPAKRECDTSGLAQIAGVGDKLAIAGTPTIFLANGRRVVGGMPPDQLLAAIDAASPK